MPDIQASANKRRLFRREELNPKGSQPLAVGKAVGPPPPDIGNNGIAPDRGRSLRRCYAPSGSDWFALLTGG